MSKENTADNRLYARFEYMECAVLNREGDDEPLRVIIVDIGLGGVQLRSKDKLPVGVPLKIQIGRDKKQAPLDLTGHVRYCQETTDTEGPYSSGFKFAPQSHEERVQIAQYVHSVFQRQWDAMAS